MKRTTPIPPDLLAKMRAVKGKRPRVLLKLLEKQEYVTTEQLERLGYTHPPRVAGDVKEHGIPILMIRVPNSSGRSIGAYTLGRAEHIREMSGRATFTKAFRLKLLQHYGARCTITGAPWPPRALQVDHRIPYQIAGNAEEDVRHYMLLDAASQRAKSFSCETCPNFLGPKNADICRRCFWAFPDDFDHVATEHRRRVTIDWVGDEIAAFTKLKAAATDSGQLLADYIKAKLR